MGIPQKEPDILPCIAARSRLEHESLKLVCPAIDGNCLQREPRLAAAGGSADDSDLVLSYQLLQFCKVAFPPPQLIRLGRVISTMALGTDELLDGEKRAVADRNVKEVVGYVGIVVPQIKGDGLRPDQLDPGVDVL